MTITAVTISARRLHQDLDGLAFPARQRLLAATARNLAPSELDQLLDEMYAGSAYERRLGLQMAIVARHGGYVERCLDAPDSGVVVRAAAIAVRLDVAGDALQSRLASLPTAHRRAVYSAVRRHHAVSTAEALLPIVQTNSAISRPPSCWLRVRPRHSRRCCRTSGTR